MDGAKSNCNLDGSHLRVLSRVMSHVMWFDEAHLSWWDSRGKQAVLGAGIPFENGVAPQPLAPGVPNKMFYDTPYRSIAKLFTLGIKTNEVEDIGQFGGHMPRGGPFRCDLHPVPTPDGQSALVTTLASASRQLWIAERD